MDTDKISNGIKVMNDNITQNGRNSTKEKLLYAALTLFSEKGYERTSVDQIAESIGIKGPSIYRYFKGKDDLFDKLVEIGENYYKDNFDVNEERELPKSLEELAEISLRQINFTMHDDIFIKFRRLFILEQFRSNKVAKLTTKHHIYYLENLYRVVFEKMIEAGILKDNDAGVMAMEYVSPVTMMLHMVDRQPEKEEEAMERIRKHFEYFALVNGV